MKERQRNFSNRRAGYLLIAGALFLLGSLVVVVRFPAPSPPSPVKATPTSARRQGIASRPISHFQSSDLPASQSDFYRTIIDNNLFRPLGWTLPRPVEPYRLLGTILPRDGHTAPQAIIQVSTAGDKTHIVSIGDTLDMNTKVVDIQPKQVVLDRVGQQTTLKLDTSPWISTSKGHFSHRR